MYPDSRNDGKARLRADHVGSLLRPEGLRLARESATAGRITSEELREIEDDCVTDAVVKQLDLGLHAVTDGEFRRGYWHFDFLAGLNGVDLKEVDLTHPSATAFSLPHTLEITGRVSWNPQHPFLDHYAFLQAEARGRVPKLTIPAPSMLHFRFGAQALQSGAYREIDGLIADLGAAYAGAVTALSQRGCRYLQFDEVNLAMLCDPVQVEQARARGIFREDLPRVYAGLINSAVSDRPADMTIGMHLCRGNFRSTSLAAGGYDPVADVLFNEIDVDTYYMEYDTERAGGFEPLRYLPAGYKTVVLGLVSSKSGTLESRDVLLRRIEDAARYAPLEQLAISPQCGFASTEAGNTLTEAEQWDKLRLCVDVAQEVWGRN